MGPIRPARRPPGWTPPGPKPAGPGDDPTLQPADDEDLCFLCGDFRVFQKLRGHRWSVDDLVTAWVAIQAASHMRVETFADLGCGIGSVLMQVAWAFESANGVGVEAQTVSAAMARRSLRYNGIADRVRVLDGDLRHVDLRSEQSDGFDLVTGTPPYFPTGEGVESKRTQRAPARFEHRGGATDYLRAANTTVSDTGVIALCCGPGQREDLEQLAPQLGLSITWTVEALGRPGLPPRFAVYVLSKQAVEQKPLFRLTVRDTDGTWTPEFVRLRTDMGMPVLEKTGHDQS